MSSASPAAKSKPTVVGVDYQKDAEIVTMQDEDGQYRYKKARCRNKHCSRPVISGLDPQWKDKREYHNKSCSNIVSRYPEFDRYPERRDD